MEVISNKAATSNKKRITLVSRTGLDTMRPGWYNETQTVNVEKYIYDPRMPHQFLTYPPAAATAQVELMYAEVPEPHALTEVQLMNSATSEVIRVADIYAAPLLDYILYRAYSKDSEQQNNAQRAMAHYQAMAASLGMKAQSDPAAQPGAA